jgi:hypothetical protein
MNVSVNIAIEKLKGLLRPEDVQPALRAAVRLTSRAYITRGSRQIGETVNLKIATIKRQFKAQFADQQQQAQALVTTSRKGVPLFEYLNSAQAFRASKRPRGGVRVRVRGTAEQHPHAFVATMKSGHVGIFHRGDKSKAIIGAKRMPIYEEHGPTAVGVFANAPDTTGQGTIFQASCIDAGDVLAKNIGQQISRFLAKYAAAG